MKPPSKRRGRPSLKWLRHTDVAELFGVSPESIIKMCELGIFAKASYEDGVWEIAETAIRTHISSLEKLYTVTQFADLIGLDVRTVRAGVSSGRIRASKLDLGTGIRVRIPRSEFYRLQGRSAPRLSFFEEGSAS